MSLVLGIITSIFLPLFIYVVLFGIVLYLSLSFVAALTQVKISKLLLLVWFGIIATHLIYGLYFLFGLSRRELKR